MDKIERHAQLSKINHEMYVKKNNDYGDSVAKTFQEFGLVSTVVRISDKYNRLVFLTKNPKQQKVQDETIIDTLMDMANYCLMAVIEVENAKEQKERKMISDGTDNNT